MKFPDSIRGRLFLWSFAFISLLLVIVGTALYHKSRHAIFVSIDHTLDSKIEIVAGLLHMEGGKIEFELSEIVSGAYSVPKSGSYYKVIIDNRVFAFSPSLVNSGFDFIPEEGTVHEEKPGDTAYTSTGPGHERVRVMRHGFEFLGRHVTIFLAESIEDDLAAISRIKIFLLAVIPASILTGAFAVFLIATRSLKPLQEFSMKVSQITHEKMGERIDSESQTQELAGLADSFNKMLDRIGKAFEIERRIISDASHELKTPLSIIKVQCEVILGKKRTQEEYIDALETISGSAKTMSKLVNNLLSLARLDSGQLAPSGFTTIIINECLEEALQSVIVLAARNNVQVNTSVHDDIRVSGNKEKMCEALRNVIENAVRYNRPGGRVDITANAGPGRAEIRVSDTGAGIEARHMEKIFERFYRADASRSTEGTGLGLSIAKAVIEAHGGTIRAESTAGKGSVFFISLPLVG